MAPCSLLLALAAAAPSTELFEKSTPAFRVFTTADGLPQNTAQALAVDARGHLWVGTQGGLAVGEGRRWRTVALPGENVSRVVSAILPAADGSLWIGTSGSGVFRLRAGQWTYADSGLPSAFVHSLLEAAGSIWAGTSAGLARFAGDRWLSVALTPPLADPGITVLYRTEDPETLWVGTSSGLLRYQGGAWTLLDRAAGLPDDRVRSLLETRERDGGRALWVGTEGGLAQLRGGLVQVIDRRDGLPAFPAHALAETRDANGKRALWVGTHGGGLAVLREERWRVFDKQSGLPGNKVERLLAAVAPSGRTTLWIGSDDGLARLVDGGFRWFPNGPAFLRDKVYALQALESGPAIGIWIASDSGLFRFHRGQWTSVPMPVLQGDRPNSFLAARDGSLLVGTGQGLLLEFAGATVVPVPFPAEAGNSVRSMAEVVDPMRGPELWVARRSGLLVRRGGRWISYDTSAGLKGNWHTKVAVSDGGGRPTVWVGGWSGLSRFDGERFVTLDRRDGLPDNVVNSIFPTVREGRHELWLATRGGAVRMDLDRPRGWTTFSEISQPPLPSNAIYTILADAKDRLYLCTEKGVVRLSTGTPAALSATAFAKEDGLPGSECLFNASMVDSAGRIWVGTTRGVAVFDPALEPPQGGPKPLLIERSFAHGREREIDGATLTFRENALRFEYSLLSYFRDDETRFRTQLVGLDEEPTEWSADPRREFTTLPAGRYEFRVWGRDHAGNVSGPVARRFLIARAPWVSLWAIALYGVALAGLIGGAIALRTRALRRRAERLEEIVVIRTRQLEDKNHELLQANSELVALQREADRIFSALTDALEGKVIDGRYRIEERIGQGGFGAVFRAVDLTTSVPVAIKVFRPQAANASPQALERFRQEAQSGQQVLHRNAVAVLGSGVSNDGILYLVMELLEGQSLRAELAERKKLPLPRAVAIAVQMLEALAEAHRKGIVHRDIKPENVFLHRGPEGELVKLVDFGVAKMKGAAVRERSLTLTGGVVGTPGYMAPERLQELLYDGRSDVYSVGVVLYEMLLGHPPFESKDGGVYPLMMMHIERPPPPPREEDPTIPAGVADLLLAALAKDPAQRPTAERLAVLMAETLRPERRAGAALPRA